MAGPNRLLVLIKLVRSTSYLNNRQARFGKDICQAPDIEVVYLYRSFRCGGHRGQYHRAAEHRALSQAVVR
jgi:hypothetical protein